MDGVCLYGPLSCRSLDDMGNNKINVLRMECIFYGPPTCSAISAVAQCRNAWVGIRARHFSVSIRIHCLMCRCTPEREWRLVE